MLVADYRLSDGEYLRLRLVSPGYSDITRSLDRNRSRVEFLPYLNRGEAVRDFTVFLNDRPIGHVRLVRDAPPARGALDVDGGSVQDFGAIVTIERRPPARVRPNGEPIPIEFQLVRRGRALRGGADAVDDIVVTEMLIDRNGQHLAESQRTFEDLDPGPYEARLLQNGFMIDRQPFDVIVPERPGALRITSADEAGYAGVMIVEFSAPAMSGFNAGPGYMLRLVELQPSGLRTPETFQFVQHAEPEVPYTFAMPPTGGEFAVQLLIDDMDSTRYLLDERPFFRRAPQVIVSPTVASDGSRSEVTPTVPFSFTIAGRPQFGYDRIRIREGDDIPVMIDLSGMQGERAELMLFRASEPMRPGPLAMQTPVGEVLERWPIEGLEKTGFDLDADLEPGHYRLALTMSSMGRAMPLLTHPFEVMASGGRFGLRMPGGGRVFLLGEEPEATWSDPGGAPLDLSVKPLGHRVPGCAIEFRQRPFALPALHLASLSRASVDGTADLVAQRGFDLLATPLTDALGMARRAWVVGETIAVTANVPDDHPLRQGREGRIEVVRLGTRLEGGSESAVAVEQRSEYLDFSSGLARAEFVFDKPGHYEARLIQSHNGCGLLGGRHYDCVLLDRSEFVVREELSPFNDSDGGLSAFGVANDLGAAGSVWPAVGEAMSEAECAVGERLIEDMELNLVERIDGSYRPIEGPVEYGRAFVIEGRLKEPARRAFYPVSFDLPFATADEINLYRDDSDPTIVRSELLYAIWPTEEQAGGSP
ncbi:hypothetical protein [Halomonas denitrificans]|nr:hypothetical protein [Halomonas denitrificans]